MAKSGTIKLAACGLAVALALGQASPVFASAEGRFVAMLDHRAAMQTVKPKSIDDPVGQIVCTWYADLMVRETGTDTPEPNDAVLVPIRHGGVKPACKSRPGAGAITVKTQGLFLMGRKRGFLIWDESDPNGAEGFLVMSAATGKVLFTGATSPPPGLRRTAALRAGVLHLGYTRGYNAPCSLLQNPRACWAQLVAAGVVSAAAPPLTQAPASCRAAYKGQPASDPSVILFTTEVTIDAAGKSTVLSRGPVSCLPMP